MTHKYKALEIPTKWPKVHHSFNARLIPARLEELARQGVYFESKVLEDNKKIT